MNDYLDNEYPRPPGLVTDSVHLPDGVGERTTEGP